MIDEVGQGLMLARLDQATSWVGRSAACVVFVAVSCSTALIARPARPPDAPDGRQARGVDQRPESSDRDRARIDRLHREEGEAILAIANAAAAGKRVPSDFALEWQNEFIKAQRGTFVPFTLTVDAARLTRPTALVYVRATRRDQPAARGRRESDEPYPVDAIFPVELAPSAGVSRISRGFSVPSGEYDVLVVMRERVDPEAPRPAPKAAVVRQQLSVPEFWSGELTTSSVIVADRLTTLVEDVPADRLAERPYVIGRLEVTPAPDRKFRRDEELVVVLLVYHPMVTAERQFDVKVEYHFFRQVGRNAPGSEPGVGELTHPPVRPGERYFNHTDPQRFTPALMGAMFNPSSGEPVLAGQVVPLAGFEIGEYRLDVQVVDLLSGRSVSRDVFFRVGD
jgi:hypothetical protein